MSDLYLDSEITGDSGVARVNSMALWRYFPRQITPYEAHQLYMQWFVVWFIPWFEWLKAQQTRDAR